MMDKGELKALRERLEQDEAFVMWMQHKRNRARLELEQAALNRINLSTEQVERIMADYAAITRLSHELLPKGKQHD